MKKSVFIVASLALSFAGNAQKINIQNALNAINQDKDYAKALEYIDKAEKDPSTAKDPKTFFIKGKIYTMMAADPKNADKGYYKQGIMAFLEEWKLKPNYNEDETSQYLFPLMFTAYNNGIKAYNDAATDRSTAKFDEAAENMKMINDIYVIGEGAKAKDKKLDTINSTSKLIRANSVYYAGKLDEALPLLIEAKNDPVIKSAAVYMSLVDIYKKQKKDAELLAIIQEGKVQYPNNETLRNEELNYYIKTGKQDELTKKLQDAITKDPNNADLYYNLGVQYYNSAYPQSGKAANAAELAGKAAEAYTHAIQLAPDNAGYNYNLGAMYVNEAADVSETMSKLGTSAADEKKYDAAKKDRDALLAKGQPYLEKAFAILDPKAATLKGDDRDTYHSTMVALKSIYASQSKMDKSNEMKAKLEAMNK